MEQIIQIQDIHENKTKQGKPYWVIVTDKGSMSCFDLNITKAMKDAGSCKVDIVEKGDFKNITKLISVMAQPEAKAFGDIKLASMCLSYAKDLICAGKAELKDLEALHKRLIATLQ